MQYVIEVPDDHPEWALDDVTMQKYKDGRELKEFSQNHIGESILGHRKVKRKEVKRMIKEMNPEWVARWGMDDSLKVFCNLDTEEEAKSDAI